MLSSNLCRCTGYQNIIKAVRAAAATRCAKARGREPRHEHGYPDAAARASERRVLGHAVPRIEDRPLVTGHGRYAGDIDFPASAAHAHRALAHRAWRGSCRSTPRRRCALPGVVAVWTNADIADLPPIDFRADKSADGIQRLPPAGAGARPACAMSAIRSRPCSPRTPIVAEDAAELVDGRGRRRCRSLLSAQRSARRVRRRPQHRGDHRCATATATSTPRSATRTRWSSSISQPAATPACRWRRAAPSAATTRRRDVLELHGAAKMPHRNRETLLPHARAQPVVAARASRAISAAASASAASFIPRTCWCWSPRCASAGR